ncbi:hypothetical protein L484_022479 [Morus notabilis]|uniref:Uncharacterized protein n=1 Tax=Morus notabilis TaxID=981085 RepID=W9QS61_9ROSA|nr:hypothetical protein L484_022479 [Morus notabilis]
MALVPDLDFSCGPPPQPWSDTLTLTSVLVLNFDLDPGSSLGFRSQLQPQSQFRLWPVTDPNLNPTLVRNSIPITGSLVTKPNSCPTQTPNSTVDLGPNLGVGSDLRCENTILTHLRTPLSLINLMNLVV